MPKAALPSHPLGWLVALLASFVGFIAGFVAIAILTKILPHG
jgi:hypothetical protein